MKISDNEILWYTGKNNLTDGILELRNQFNIPLILLSMGPDGSRAYYKDKLVEVKAFLNECTIDTTGAGDTFFGCALKFILENGIH